MNIQVLAFGIAKDILGQQLLPLEVSENTSVLLLKELLVRDYPEFAKLAGFSIAVNNEYRQDDYLLSEADEIAIIPPVSGG